MSVSDRFAIQVTRPGLGPWRWSIIDQDGAVVSRGQGRRQDEALRRAMVRARSLSEDSRLAEAA